MYDKLLKGDFSILFKDSPEYFIVENARMIFEDKLVRFVCFDEANNFKEDIWYPLNNIFRIKREFEDIK
jgi:hypothetical protein